MDEKKAPKASELIDTVIKNSLAGLLKEEGYRKDRRTFRRLGDGCIQVVNVQLGMWNIYDMGRFTINLGIYHREVGRVVFGMEFEKPKEYECAIRERIGDLMDCRNDHWWHVNKSTDLNSIANEVADAWKNHGRQWIEKYSVDVRHALNILIEENYGARTIAEFYIALGEVGKAKELMDKIIVEQPHFRDTYDQWVKRFDIQDS